MFFKTSILFKLDLFESNLLNLNELNFYFEEIFFMLAKNLF
jgi:hypothetical protein